MAIKVIKQGVKEFHITCPNCGCECICERGILNGKVLQIQDIPE